MRLVQSEKLAFAKLFAKIINKTIETITNVDHMLSMIYSFTVSKLTISIENRYGSHWGPRRPPNPGVPLQFFEFVDLQGTKKNPQNPEFKNRFPLFFETAGMKSSVPCTIITNYNLIFVVMVW